MDNIFKNSEGSIDPLWLEELQAALNSAQYAFATAGEPALLGLAGPGSGKTRALVYRAAHLIKAGLRPEELLLLTFTNKAAGEMKERLEKLIGYLPHYLWAGTFHSIGARILRSHAPLTGRTPNFTILDEDDSRALFKQILASFGLGTEESKTIMKRGFAARIISQARNCDLSVTRVMEEDYPYLLQYLEVIERLAERYENKKQENNAFDFDDLLLYWLFLMENNAEVKEHYRSRFSHVLVDEFQDTNIVQARIISQFAGSSSICVVGDDAQSIYAFRHAEIGNILSFPEKYANSRLIRLEQNYRSTPEIVTLANSSIAHNRQQLPKKLFSKNPSGEKPIVAKVNDARQEAALLLQTIWQLNEQGVSNDEIAVLYRSSYLTPEVEFALSRKGLSYKTYGGVKFFQKAHIKDLLAYLKVVNNPFDEISWRRIALLQKGLGPATFEKLWDKLKLCPDPLQAVLQKDKVPARGKEGWQSLVSTLDALVKMGPEKVPDLLYSALENNYHSILIENYPDQHQERLQGIERLAVYAQRFQSLDLFLQSLALEESVFADPAAAALSTGQLTLSTIHSAKGKEWDCVFIIGMNQGHFPGAPAGTKELSEERRLFYVAVTRARRYLCMTTYLEDYRSYGAASQGPSQFLRELPPQCYRLLDLSDGYTYY